MLDFKSLKTDDPLIDAVEILRELNRQRRRRVPEDAGLVEHVTQDDPERKARLMKELDGFLERDRDRGLFDLPPPKEISDGNSG